VKDESRYDKELDQLFEQLGVERAPARLRRRLRRIPREQSGLPGSWLQRLFAPPRVRWVLAPALAAALVVVGVLLTLPRQPSQAEILQARQDVALAFHYIDKAGLLAGREIEAVLDGELRDPVKDSLSSHIPFTEQSRKEDTT
jgi:hypothetical protein